MIRGKMKLTQIVETDFTSGLDGNDKPFIGIEHANGLAITMLEHSLVLKNAAGDCYIELKDGQIVFNGNEVHNGGATFGDPAAAKPLAIAPLLIAYLNAQEEAIIGNMKAIVGSPEKSRKVRFDCIYDHEKNPEDVAFTKATPSGFAEFTIDNPAALEQLKVGEFYYVDFSPVPKAE